MHEKLSGITMVALGTLTLLQVLGVQYFGLALWPAITLWIGLEIVWGSIFDGHLGGGSWFGATLGLVVTAIGLVPILANAGYPIYLTTGEIIRNSWPFLLVGLGVSLLFGRGRRHHHHCEWD
jgi:hypothetical protein